jgi:hypothetical protein
VAYDVVSTAHLNTLEVQAGGDLHFRTDVDTQVIVGNFLVLAGGSLEVGTSANPVSAGVTAQIIIADQAINTTNDPEQFGTGLIGLGTVTMQGAVKSPTFIRLAAEPLAGQATLTLAQPASGWRPGDKISLPDTRQLNEDERWTGYTPQWELRTIQSISPDGLVLTLSSPLQYDHLGARDGNGVLDFLPDVANLTRNVVVRSENITGTRGYAMFTDRADVDIRYVQFSGLGRTTNVYDDDTTFDASGNVTHIGTNQGGRYPVYFRHLMGPASSPQDGYQFTFTGNSVFCPLDPMPFRWGITLQDSHYGLVSENVLYNWAGAGIVTQDGNESYNVFEHNFVMAIRGDSNPRYNDGLDGSAFWFHGFNNYVRDNVAADAVGTLQGIVAGSGFNLWWSAASDQNTAIPLFPGADLRVTGQYKLVDMQLTPILEFARNESYGAMATGLTLWNLGTDGYSTRPIGESVIKDFRAWHVWEEGFFAYPIQNVTLDGFVVRGDPRAWGQGAGWDSGDYWAGNVTIKNADIQGMTYGVRVPGNTPGTFTIENSYFRNYISDIAVSTLSTPGTVAPQQARTTHIINCRFDPWDVTKVPTPYYTPQFSAISMDYSADWYHTNLTQTDSVFVTGYNQVVGDDFQVFYNEQAANFIVPQTSTGLIGSPVAGLTNQQDWQTYGIAIAGAVAPTTATTRSGIKGLVSPT